MTSALVVLAGALAGFHKWRQWRGKVAQELLLSKHRSFFAEVERAWERSHPQVTERRREQRQREQIRVPPDIDVRERPVVSPEVIPTKRKGKARKREEIVEVEDDF